MVGTAVRNSTAEGVDLLQLTLLIATGRPFQRIQIHRIGDAKILEGAKLLPVDGFGQTNFSRNAVVEVWKDALAVHTLWSSGQAQQQTLISYMCYSTQLCVFRVGHCIYFLFKLVHSLFVKV